MADKALICFLAHRGTTGDIRPLVALALALRSRGFDILLFGDSSHERLASRAGVLPSEWLSGSLVPQSFTFRTTAGQRWLWGRRPRWRDRWMDQELARHEKERIAAFWRRVGGADNPRILAAIGSISAYRTLVSFGPQCAKIISCPMPYQPSRHFTLIPPDLSLSERIEAWRLRRFLRSEQRRFCEETFHLVSASPSLFPRPLDWLPNMQVTGYVPLEDQEHDWSPPRELADFLLAGSAPVYVGFGSYPFFYGRRGQRLAQEIIQGCRRRNVRCIIQSPDLPRALAADQEQVYILDGDAPHAWLFPRCRAIVHHGGYGTVHAALMAQRPMIIYPFQTDQFLWARRAGDLGVGPGFTARLRDLSAARLERDLDCVLSPERGENAKRSGTALTQDRGLAVQLLAIESAIAHVRRGQPLPEWRMPEAAAAA